MQALPFSDALKLLSYLKDWILNPDKVLEALAGREACVAYFYFLFSYLNKLVFQVAYMLYHIGIHFFRKKGGMEGIFLF